jgi:hypothetical protein
MPLAEVIQAGHARFVGTLRPVLLGFEKIISLITEF